MPYTMFDELTVTFDEATAKEVYAYVTAEYPGQDAETLIWENVDFVKRTFDSSKHRDFLEYVWEAIKNNHAAAGKQKEESIKPVLEILTELFYDKERAEKIYCQVQNKYADCDELIRANIDFAKKKEKKLGIRFLPYLQEAIEKNAAEYSGEQDI
ncbi:hypothetical protein R80B4_01099 [Fibrobacteres bacterium R8-0-B4]